MVLVSDEHKFIYLKTEKTGSTSIEMALQPLCAPPGASVPHYGPAIISKHGIVGARGDEFFRVDQTGFRSHMAAAAVARRVGRRKWRRYLKIAALRNPYDKAVSWYWFMARKQKLKQTEPIADFRAFIRDKDAKGYFRSPEDIDWRVTRINGEQIIDQYIRLEHLEDDFLALFDRLELAGVTLEMPKVKAETRQKDALDVQDYFDTATADLVKHHWGWMFEAGGYSMDPADARRASEGTERRIVAPHSTHGRQSNGPALSGRILRALRQSLTGHTP